MEKKTLKRMPWVFASAISLLVSLAILTPLPSQAADNYWIGGDGDLWNDGTKWDTGQQPQESDNGFLTHSDVADQTVIYQSTINPTLNLVLIEGTGGGAMTLSQGQDSLTTRYLTIGDIGNGIYTQTGGNVTVGGLPGADGTLTLGNQASGVGTYNLQNGDLIFLGNQEFIGASGQGYFNQSGGTHTFNGAMYLGADTGYGKYTMTGGILQVGLGGEIVLGEYGQGEFIQSGGDVTVNGLTLARQSGSTGNYSLSDTDGPSTLTVYGNTVVGNEGTGTFTQTGGTFYVNGDLNLGGWTTGNGTYNLNGGDLTTTYVLRVGDWGSGTFIQRGGINTTNQLVLAENESVTGMYNLENGELYANWESIGDNGTGIFTQTGGTHTATEGINIGLYVGSTGTYDLQGGTLSSGYIIVGNQGTGIFTQSGGTNTVTGDLVLGNELNSSGTYNLSGTGSLSVKGPDPISDPYRDVTIGLLGTGTFTQNDDTSNFSVSGALVLGGESTGYGYYEMNGGTLTTNFFQIGRSGNGDFIQTGGTVNTVKDSNGERGDLNLGQAFGSKGTYDLSGTGSVNVGRTLYIGASGEGIFTRMVEHITLMARCMSDSLRAAMANITYQVVN